MDIEERVVKLVNETSLSLFMQNKETLISSISESLEGSTFTDSDKDKIVEVVVAAVGFTMNSTMYGAVKVVTDVLMGNDAAETDIVS